MDRAGKTIKLFLFIALSLVRLLQKISSHVGRFGGIYIFLEEVTLLGVKV